MALHAKTYLGLSLGERLVVRIEYRLYVRTAG